MSDSIDSLIQNLTKEQFRERKKYFSGIDYLKKGVFPYKYIDSEERYNEKQLSGKEAFYNALRKEHITEEKNFFANKVREKFNCKTLGEYSDLYMKFDVLLLADIFENIRDVSINTYQLDPCWYFFATPGLAWDAMLKLTKIKLEHIKDIDMLLFLKNGIRGGISQVSHSHCKTNKKYVDSRDKGKPSKFLVYLDANN